MDWAPQQDTALKLVERWRTSGRDPVFMLGGYAGTGKTTLARHFAASVPGRVCFAAYTGKAAHVLRRSGVPSVSTIHKLIYLPKEKCRAKLKELEAQREQLMTLPSPTAEQTQQIRQLNVAIAEEMENLARPAWTLNTDSELVGASLLVIDEYSMVDQQMGEDLLNFDVPILALGDPGQLPPVRGHCFFGRQPDYMLTEIHRQASDNPIIRLSKDVREGRVLAPGTYGSSRVAPLGDLPKDELRAMILGTDQLLVGRNATRRSSNRRTRELLERKDVLPEVGDKLVCLRNNHQAGLLNGQTWSVMAPLEMDEDFLVLDVGNEDGDRVTCLAHPNHFVGTADSLDYWTRRSAEEFDYGYALTVHKAQGSQWDRVVLFDEWYGQDRQKWLYTAITRAAETITVVQM